MNKKNIRIIFLLYLIISLECNTIRFLGNKEEKEEKRERKRGGRRAGVLMHITSLPSKYGIGTLGEESYKFVDWLVLGKQKVWQILPLGPTGYGDSPYQSFSSYAGNHYLIDLDILIKEGLITQQEVDELPWGNNPRYVDFGNLYIQRNKILRKAFSRFKINNEYIKFINENKDWLDDYSLFMSIKQKFNNKPWTEWPDKDLRLHKKEALDKIREELKNEIEYINFLQYKFDEQWNKLRNYAHAKEIELFGDVPIYVPLDSSDTWSSPDMFQLDENGIPLAVAGCPPDAFTADGQLWGNPLYNWDKMKSTGFKWWINRLKSTGKKFDIIRIDHFRGLESYWSVPNGDIPYGDTTARKTARYGKWIKGPDESFIDAIHKNLPDLDFVAEDLGYLTPEVLHLREYSGFPGMKLLQFAFDSREASDYLPHGYIKNTVCYLGTHDNDTIMGWQKTISDEDRQLAEKYLGLSSGADLRMPLFRAGFSSVSDLFIGTMQDYIGLGSEARFNRPGITDGKNWIWRALPDEITDKIAEFIEEMTILYNRAPKISKQKIPILVGDIGGTNSRLKLLKISSDPKEKAEILKSAKLKSFDYKTVSDLIKYFLKEYKDTINYPKYASIAIPGPVKDNTVLGFTNIPHWGIVKGEDIKEELGFDNFTFLNDFAANGYGVQTKLIKNKDFIVIHDVKNQENGVKGLIGAGTGLGIGFLVKEPDTNYYIVNPSEGSHYDFPARDDKQVKYMHYLEKYYNIDHVSVERATCGQSLIPIYQFIVHEENIKNGDELYEEIMNFKDTTNSQRQIEINNMIVTKGVKKECELCYKTLEFFIELYGQALGNISLVTIPTGGLYILGGLSAALEPLLVNNDIFLDAFFDKGRLSHILKEVPIYLVLNDDIGTIGAIEFCRREIENE